MVILQIWEVLRGRDGQGSASKRSMAGKGDARTEFEKNATKLRSKERKLKPRRPVAPIQHRD